MSFHECVRDWLRSRKVDAADVTDVQGYGTDWYGDTEGGFSERFDVTISYVDSRGRAHRKHDVCGEDLASLWSWVVNGYTNGHNGEAAPPHKSGG